MEIEMLNELNERLEDYWHNLNKESWVRGDIPEVAKMLEHIKEHNLRKGKRLRGYLVNLAYGFSGKKITDEVWMAMVAMELMQTALLIHDDMMDEDKIRRGGLTTQYYYGGGHLGDAMAVCAGDFMFFLASNVICKYIEDGYKVKKIMMEWTRGIAETGVGQLLDILNSGNIKMEKEEVNYIYCAKTAIYSVWCPMYTGLVLGGIEDKYKEIVFEFAKNLGVTFQIKDDLLGVFGVEEETGKANDSDIREGKATLIIVEYLVRATEAQKKILKKVWGKRETAKEQDIEVLKQKMIEMGLIEEINKRIESLEHDLFGNIEKMKEMGLDGGRLEKLRELVEYVVNRKK